jgi:hypothetical protein
MIVRCDQCGNGRPLRVLAPALAATANSAALGTAAVGPTHTALGLPAALTYTFPVALCLYAVAFFFGYLTADEPSRHRAKHVVFGIGLLLGMASAVAVPVYTGGYDLGMLAIVGLTGGVGPCWLATLLHREGHDQADQQG